MVKIKTLSCGSESDAIWWSRGHHLGGIKHLRPVTWLAKRSIATSRLTSQEMAWICGLKIWTGTKLFRFWTDSMKVNPSDSQNIFKLGWGTTHLSIFLTKTCGLHTSGPSTVAWNSGVASVSGRFRARRFGCSPTETPPTMLCIHIRRWLWTTQGSPSDCDSTLLAITPR